MFYNCYRLAAVDLSGYTDLITIGVSAFYECSSLTSVSFPASLQTIGPFAFYNTSLDTMYFSGNTVPTLSDYAFSDVPLAGTVYYPEGGTGYTAAYFNTATGGGNRFDKWTFTVVISAGGGNGDGDGGKGDGDGGKGSGNDGRTDVSGGGIKVTLDGNNAPVLSAEPTVAEPLNIALLPASAMKISDKVWTGKQIKSGLTVKMTYSVGGKTTTKTLKYNTDYTLSKAGKNKNIGRGSITLTGKAGSVYSGSKALAFKIVPKKPTAIKLTAGKRSLTVKWKKVGKAQKVTGYQVHYRYKTGAKWSGWKTKTFKVSYKAKAKTVAKTIKKLKAGKLYQVSVRAYKKVGAVKYYGAWSKAKRSKKIA